MKKLLYQKSFTIFFVLFLFSFSLMTIQINHTLASSSRGDWKSDVKNIDLLIKELNEKKLGYEGRAVSLENQAQRLQFDQGELSLAKKKFQLADQNRKLAEQVEQEIQFLKQKKAEILRKHNIETVEELESIDEK